MRVDSLEDIRELFNQLVLQPTSAVDLFKKALILNRYHVNIGLDYVLIDDCKVTCSELFVNILMRDLLANSDLQEDSNDFKLVRQFLLSVLKARKSGVIWRFVAADIRVRYKFLATLDVRKCPSFKKYCKQLLDIYLMDAFE